MNLIPLRVPFNPNYSDSVSSCPLFVLPPPQISSSIKMGDFLEVVKKLNPVYFGENAKPDWHEKVKFTVEQ